jgi:hypothetical protein
MPEVLDAVKRLLTDTYAYSYDALKAVYGDI